MGKRQGPIKFEKKINLLKVISKFSGHKSKHILNLFPSHNHWGHQVLHELCRNKLIKIKIKKRSDYLTITQKGFRALRMWRLFQEEYGLKFESKFEEILYCEDCIPDLITGGFKLCNKHYRPPHKNKFETTQEKGLKAGLEGKPESECPYKVKAQARAYRYAWLRGWSKGAKIYNNKERVLLKKVIGAPSA